MLDYMIGDMRVTIHKPDFATKVCQAGLSFRLSRLAKDDNTPDPPVRPGVERVKKPRTSDAPPEVDKS